VNEVRGAGAISGRIAGEMVMDTMEVPFGEIQDGGKGIQRRAGSI